MIKALKHDIIPRKLEREEILFHLDRDSQYSIQVFYKVLKQHDYWSSISSKWACWDNAVVKRFLAV